MKKRLLGYYDYTVILTYCGMLFALLGIFLASHKQFVYAAICLMLAGGCDMFDGSVASTKDRTPPEKLFGIQIDSMCDLISFGVLPGFFVYFFFGMKTFAAVVCMIFVLCALIRLSFFNVLEEQRQRETSGKREEYLGIPVTSIAATLPLFCILNTVGIFPDWTYFVLLLLSGAGFISSIVVKKPQKNGKVILILVGIIEFVVLFILAKNH